MQRPCDWKERGMFGEFERRLMWVGRERRGREKLMGDIRVWLSQVLESHRRTLDRTSDFCTENDGCSVEN